MGSLDKKMHLVDMSSLSILFQAKSGVLQQILVWVLSGIIMWYSIQRKGLKWFGDDT